MRLIPGLEELVIARLPLAEAPITILMAANSLSACTKTRFSSGILLAI